MMIMRRLTENLKLLRHSLRSTFSWLVSSVSACVRLSVCPVVGFSFSWKNRFFQFLIFLSSFFSHGPLLQQLTSSGCCCWFSWNLWRRWQHLRTNEGTTRKTKTDGKKARDLVSNNSWSFEKERRERERRDSFFLLLFSEMLKIT